MDDRLKQDVTEMARGLTSKHQEKLALSMESGTFDSDPAPAFPEWLAGATVVSEIARRAERDEPTAEDPAERPLSRSSSEEAGAGENHDERTRAPAPN